MIQLLYMFRYMCTYILHLLARLFNTLTMHAVQNGIHIRNDTVAGCIDTVCINTARDLNTVGWDNFLIANTSLD